MAKPTSAQVQSAITYFVKEYQKTFGKAIRVNRNTAKWGIEGILTDIDMDELKSLIDFYFTTGHADHDLAWFLYNYDKLLESQEAVEEDKASRAKLRQESEERAKRWKEQHGYQGIADA